VVGCYERGNEDLSPIKAENFLTCWMTVSFSRTLLYGVIGYYIGLCAHLDITHEHTRGLRCIHC
jgi:hypothetical protein